jgi:hypothetical protein
MENIILLALNKLMATRKRFMLPLLGITIFRTLLGISLYYSLRAGISFSAPFIGGSNFDGLYSRRGTAPHTVT